jgi:protein disulfide-isomerase A1
MPAHIAADSVACVLCPVLLCSTKYAREMEDLGWKGKDSGFVIESADGKRKFKFDRAFKAENILKFAEDWTAGKLEAWVKSEEPPVSNDGPVKIVTGKTFADIVANDKDVLIEFCTIASQRRLWCW